MSAPEKWAVRESCRDMGTHIASGFDILAPDDRGSWISNSRAAEILAELLAALEPFALISSEGVVSKADGHVSVTTCAEYFHRAAAAFAKVRP